MFPYQGKQAGAGMDYLSLIWEEPVEGCFPPANIGDENSKGSNCQG